jgi:hypothetical protein
MAFAPFIILNMSKNRSKRLRKKLNTGEFQELGFEISFSLPANLDSETQGRFFDQFLAGAIESNGLLFGGGFSKDSEGFATLAKRGSATEEHRVRVRSWLAANPLVADVQIGELVNAWV